MKSIILVLHKQTNTKQTKFLHQLGRVFASAYSISVKYCISQSTRLRGSGRSVLCPHQIHAAWVIQSHRIAYLTRVVNVGY